MSQIYFATAGIEDLARSSNFLHHNNPLAAKQAGLAIIKALKILSDYPQAGRPEDDNSEYRELIIDFGNSGYFAKYHFKHNLVTVVKIKHQKEVGYF